MRGTKVWLLFLFAASLATAHRSFSLVEMHFGTFWRPAPPASNEMAWTEITFFPGGLFTIKLADSTCEILLGHGEYIQKSDTLILQRLRSWEGTCGAGFTENLIVAETKYRLRLHGQDALDIRFLSGKNKALQWTSLRKYGSKPSP